MQSSADHSMRLPRQNERLYAYYDAQGGLLGETTGTAPCKTLFDSAHYVVVDHEEMIKNQDSRQQIEADLSACEKALLRTSVSNMGEILYLNRLISALKHFLANKAAA